MVCAAIWKLKRYLIFYCWLFHNSIGGKLHHFNLFVLIYLGRRFYFTLLKVFSWIPLWSNITFCNTAMRDAGAKFKDLKPNTGQRKLFFDSSQSIYSPCKLAAMQTVWQKVSLPGPLEPMESRALKSGHPVGHFSFYISIIHLTKITAKPLRIRSPVSWLNCRSKQKSSIRNFDQKLRREWKAPGF